MSAGALGSVWMVAARTVRAARRDRIAGLGAEVAFFALLSIPSAILVLAGLAGFIDSLVGVQAGESLRREIIRGLGTFIAPETMGQTIEPAVESMFARGRGAILSAGALVAIWSASRMTRVFIETMNVAYGVREWRPAWRRRLLALGLTVGGLLVMLVFVPLVVAGPRLGDLLANATPLGKYFAQAWSILYWPLAAGVAVALLATLYHVAPNWTTPWRRDVPGALFAAVLWIAAAYGLRVYVSVSVEEAAIGPLAAPTVLLLWLYVSTLAVLFGAELNAEIETMWPRRAAHESSDTVDAPTVDYAEGTNRSEQM